MYKYFVLGAFTLIFFVLIKKNRVYIIPFILIIFSNINGFLDWEDFAFHGFIKFRDYGLIITIIVLLLENSFIKDQYKILINNQKKHNALYIAVLIYWAYYLLEFFYSVFLHRGVVWPIKMGRYFFYGIIVFVIYEKLKNRPIEDFEKIINVLMGFTIFFGISYIGYNLFDIDLYPGGAYEVFKINGLGEVSRNFFGFPTYTFYFLIIFVHRVMVDGGNSWKFNCLGMMIMMFCVLLMLTRGHVMVMVVLIVITVLFRHPTTFVFHRALGVALVCFATISLFLLSAKGHSLVLLARFSELLPGQFPSLNLEHVKNYDVHSNELNRMIDNVLDVNLIIMAVLIVIVVISRVLSGSAFCRSLVVIVACFTAISLFLSSAKDHSLAFLSRFSELFSGHFKGLDLEHVKNFKVRSNELQRVIDNVLDFNPYMGFGFTNISELNLHYQFSVMHGGSADNGFTNLIGVTGFVGLSIFLVIIILWLIVNIKLQIYDKEQFSKINFIFIIYMMASMLNGATMSYMHHYAPFLVYDLLAYSYFKNKEKDTSGLQFSKESQVILSL